MEGNCTYVETTKRPGSWEAPASFGTDPLRGRFHILAWGTGATEIVCDPRGEAEQTVTLVLVAVPLAHEGRSLRHAQAPTRCPGPYRRPCSSEGWAPVIVAPIWPVRSQLRKPRPTPTDRAPGELKSAGGKSSGIIKPPAGHWSSRRGMAEAGTGCSAGSRKFLRLWTTRK